MHRLNFRELFVNILRGKFPKGDYLISLGLGLIVIPENHVPEFKKKLVSYYESADISDVCEFLIKLLLEKNEIVSLCYLNR